MPELSEYTYTVHGIEHTILCTPEDAQMYGATPKNRTADDADNSVPTKMRSPQNKSEE